MSTIDLALVGARVRTLDPEKRDALQQRELF